MIAWVLSLASLIAVPPGEFEAGVAEALEQARSKYVAAVEGTGDAAEKAQATGRYGMVLQAHSLDDAALAAYREAESLDPGNAVWPYLLGMVHHGRGELEPALAAFDRALADEQGMATAHLRRGVVLLDMGRTEAAEEIFRTALEAGAAPAFAHAHLGRVLQIEGEYAEAVEHLEEALRRVPAADSLHQNLALAYRGLGDVEAARRHFALRGERPIGLPDPLMDQVSSANRSAQHYIGRAQALMKQDRPGEALTEYERALEASPGDIPAYFGKGQALQELGRKAEAEAVFREVMERDPGYAAAPFQLGVLHAERGNLDAAAGMYGRAFEINAGFLEAGYQLAAVHILLGRTPDAVAVLDRLGTLRPDNVFIRVQKARALMAADRCGEAASLLEALLRDEPGRQDALHLRAHIAVTCLRQSPEQQTRARAVLRRLAQQRPTPDVLESLAIAGWVNGDIESATRTLDRLEGGTEGEIAERWQPVIDAHRRAMATGELPTRAYSDRHPALVLPGFKGEP